MFNLFGTPFAFVKTSLAKSLIFSTHLPKRGIKLHEYQAGKLLHSYKVPIPIGSVAFNGKEALQVAQQFDDKHNAHFVVKA